MNSLPFPLSKKQLFVTVVLALAVIGGVVYGVTKLRASIELSNLDPFGKTQADTSDPENLLNQPSSTTSADEKKTTVSSSTTPAKTPAKTPTKAPAPSTPAPSTPALPAPPAPAPPPQTSGCNGAAWSPDGPDPWGGCWPGPNTTGIPNGAVLSAYTGSCNITTAGTVIDSKTVNCILSINAPNVTISRSQINGGVDVPTTAPGSASFAISDSNIHVGDNLNTGLMRRNFTATRVDITGGRRSVYCVSNCTVTDSWVHAQGGDPDGQAHFSGMRMEQYSTFRHNSITCEATRVPGSGCSAGLTGYGDFAPIQNNLIERNLFYRGGGGGSTACAYGGSSGSDGSKPYGNQAMNIRFIGNRFVKNSDNGLCGNLRTIIDFDRNRPGNEWSDNLYHDGAVVGSNGP